MSRAASSSAISSGASGSTRFCATTSSRPSSAIPRCSPPTSPASGTTRRRRLGGDPRPPPVGPRSIVRHEDLPVFAAAVGRVAPSLNDPARAPYWVLPRSAGQTLAMTAPLATASWSRTVRAFNCSRGEPGLLARFDDTTAPLRLCRLSRPSTIGPLSRRRLRGGRAVYRSAPRSGAAPIWRVAVSQPASGAVTVYVQLTTAFPWPLRGGLNAICDSCGFDPGTCPPLSAGAPQTVQGTFYGQDSGLHEHPRLRTPTLSVTSISIEPVTPSRAGAGHLARRGLARAGRRTARPERRLFTRFGGRRGVRLRELDPDGGAPGASYTGWGPALDVLGRRIRPGLVIAGDLQLAAVVNRSRELPRHLVRAVGHAAPREHLSAIADYTPRARPGFTSAAGWVSSSSPTSTRNLGANDEPAGAGPSPFTPASSWPRLRAMVDRVIGTVHALPVRLRPAPPSSTSTVGFLPIAVS